MPIHISNKKVNDIHVGTKKVLTTWIGTDRVYLASTLSMLIKGYTEKSGDSLLNANTPLKFTGENLAKLVDDSAGGGEIIATIQNGLIRIPEGTVSGYTQWVFTQNNYTLEAGTYYIKSFFISGSGNVRQQLRSVDGSTIYSDGNATFTLSEKTVIRLRIVASSGSSFDNLTIGIMIVKGSTAPTTFEPYHETFYTPTEGFSLNKVLSEEETFETITGILTKKTDVRVNDRITGWTYNLEDANTVQIFSNDIPNYKGTTAGTANLISNKLTNIVGNYNIDNLWVYGSRRVISIAKSHLVGYSDDLSREEKAQLVADYYNSLNVSFVYLLNTPQTYQKKPKTLPQWVKHVFDSSGKELEATITQ